MEQFSLSTQPTLLPLRKTAENCKIRIKDSFCQGKACIKLLISGLPLPFRKRFSIRKEICDANNVYEKVRVSLKKLY